MSRNRPLLLTTLLFFYWHTMAGQTACKMEAGVNNGIMAQFNNAGDVYFTLTVFDIESDQVLISILKNIKSGSTVATDVKKEIKNKDFTPVPKNSTEEKNALQEAKKVIIPALKQNVKEAVCFEDVIDEAQKNNKISIEKSRDNSVRIVIGDAENLLKDFRIVFSDSKNYNRIVRIKENGKYHFEDAAGNCIAKVGPNCKRYDYATDFYGGVALVGEKIYGNRMEYFFIKSDGMRASNNTYQEIISDFIIVYGYYFSKLKFKDGREVLTAPVSEEYATPIFDSICKPIKFDNRQYLVIYQKQKSGLFTDKYYYGVGSPLDNLILPDYFDAIDTIIKAPRARYEYTDNHWISAKIGKKWTLAKVGPPSQYDSTRLLLKNLYDHPVRLATSDKHPGFLLLRSGSKIGLLETENVKIICEPVYDEIDAFDAITKYAKVRIGKMYGLIDKAGNRVLPPEFDEIQPFDSRKKHAKVKKGGAYGFVDMTGAFVLPLKYSAISDFDKSGVAIVEIAGKKGCINADKKVLFPPKYDDISGFSSQGRAIVRIGDKYGLISWHSPEKEFAPVRYHKLVDLQNGAYYFESVYKDMWVEVGIIRKDGKEKTIVEGKKILKTQAEKGIAVDLKNKAIVLKLAQPEVAGVVNFSGDYIYKGYMFNQTEGDIYRDYYYFSKHRDIIELKIKPGSEYNYKYILIKNDSIIGNTCDGIVYEGYENHNLIKVRSGISNYRFGCIDFSGQYVIPVKYGSIEAFSATGYTFVRDTLRYYAIFSTSGKQMTAFDYTGHGDSSKDFVKVICKTGGIGYLHLGKNAVEEIIKCKYESGEDFIGDYAIVSESSYNYGIINTSDLIVAPFVFSRIVNKGNNSFEATKGSNVFTLRKSERQELKRLECISGDCALYEKLSKDFFEKRN